MNQTTAQQAADAMVADTGGFRAGMRARIRATGEAVAIAAVFAGEALCYAGRVGNGFGLWIKVAELEAA